MIVVRWDWTPPMGVSLVEHAKALPMMMMSAYNMGGGKGLFVLSPEIAAILDTLFVLKDSGSMLGPVAIIGTMMDIEVWVNLDNMENEVLVAEDPYDPCAAAKLVVDNLVETTVLDRLARL